MTLPAVIPISADALKVDALLRMVAECPTFQQVAGVSGAPDPAAAALDFVWARGTDTQVRPVAIAFVDAVRRPLLGMGTPFSFDSRGNVGLLLEIATPESYRGNIGDAYYDFLNTSSAIVHELWDQTGKDHALIPQSIDTLQIMASSESERAADEDDYWQAIIEVEL